MQKFPKFWAQKWQKSSLKTKLVWIQVIFAKFMEFFAKLLISQNWKIEKKKKPSLQTVNLIFLIGFQHLIIQ
jgi:hypothetical protein